MVVAKEGVYPEAWSEDQTSQQGKQSIRSRYWVIYSSGTLSICVPDAVRENLDRPVLTL
jgi:hypothetical protein